MRREEYNRGGLDYETRERDANRGYDKDEYNRGYEGRGGYGRDFETRGYNKGYDRDFDQNYMGRERGYGREFDEDRGFGYGPVSGHFGYSGYNEGNTGQNWAGRNYSQLGYGGQNYRTFGHPYPPAFLTSPYGPYGQIYPYGFSGSFGHTGFYGIRNDDELEHEVYDRLDNDWQIPDNAEIHAKVSDGVVTLTGQVRTRNAKMAAGSCAWHIPGVEDVHNNITIQSRRRQHQMNGPKTGMSMSTSSGQTSPNMGQQETAKVK